MADNGELEAGDEIKTTFVAIGESVKPVQYTVVEGQAVVEGCIILGTAEEAEASLASFQAAPGKLREKVSTLGSAILGQQFRWPRGELIYEIADDLPEPQRVVDAMEHWSSRTPIRFVERDPQDNDHRNYVAFVNGSGCRSAVGMRGGRQELVLGPNCTKGNAIHEIGHALGLWHEQSRIDRDLHVRIIWSRVQSGMEHNFYQHIHDGEDVGDYDFGSIMHYPLTAFSTSDQPTIEVLSGFEGIIGQREALSAGDIETIRRMYP